MEVKKSPKADLEGKKTMWLLLGYVFILAVMFIAFEWTERDKKVSTDTGISEVYFEEEIIPVTEQEQKQAPPPPEAPKMEEVLQIVENDAKIEESTIQNSEETGQAVEVKYVPAQAVVEEEPDEQQIFQIVEEMPEFVGGQAACMQYLSKNIKYPTISQENGIQGRVTVQFVVNKDGSICDPKILRGVDSYLDKEALRVVMGMPKWKPGKQRGKPVRVTFTLPVLFRLQ